MFEGFKIYDCFHSCECGRLITHSQGDFETHKSHGGKMKTYPTEALIKYEEIITKNPDVSLLVIRDLLASHLTRRGFYKTFEQAKREMTCLCQDILWDEITSLSSKRR